MEMGDERLLLSGGQFLIQIGLLTLTTLKPDCNDDFIKYKNQHQYPLSPGSPLQRFPASD
jgi:hypothetical protein